MSRRRRSELDDDSLLRIFSKVGCARKLAQFALVCKRWRDLSCAVSYLSFDFKMGSGQELLRNESIISSVLCRANRRAPGSLKRLDVSFSCWEEVRVEGHWLLWTTSLTTLKLLAHEWGRAVWNCVVRMQKLEDLTIHGDICTEQHLLLPQALANGLQMTRLQRCCFTNVSVSLLETILATCPALTELDTHAPALPPLRVVSSSLKICILFSEHLDDDAEATINAPNLTTLVVSTLGYFSVFFESAQSLRVLETDCRCTLHNPPGSIEKLHVSGLCDLEMLSEMLVLTPMITELHLCVGWGDGRIAIDDVLSPLANLRDLYFYGNAMLNFRAGARKLEAVTVHVWPNPGVPDVNLLEALIRLHEIQSLVVHCGNMVNYHTKKVNVRYQKWCWLFELSFFYPGRVKFV